MQPLTGFPIHGPPSYLLSVAEVNLHPLRGFGMIAWKRKTNSNEDLDPMTRLEKRTLPWLPSSRRARGLKVRNLRNMVTSLTYGVSDVIS